MRASRGQPRALPAELRQRVRAAAPQLLLLPLLLLPPQLLLPLLLRHQLQRCRAVVCPDSGIWHIVSARACRATAQRTRGAVARTDTAAPATARFFVSGSTLFGVLPVSSLIKLETLLLSSAPLRRAPKNAL